MATIRNEENSNRGLQGRPELIYPIANISRASRGSNPLRNACRQGGSFPSTRRRSRVHPAWSERSADNSRPIVASLCLANASCIHSVSRPVGGDKCWMGVCKSFRIPSSEFRVCLGPRIDPFRRMFGMAHESPALKKLVRNRVFVAVGMHGMSSAMVASFSVCTWSMVAPSNAADKQTVFFQSLI